MAGSIAGADGVGSVEFGAVAFDSTALGSVLGSLRFGSEGFGSTAGFTSEADSIGFDAVEFG